MMNLKPGFPSTLRFIGGAVLGAVLLSGCGMLPAKQHKPEPVVTRARPPPTPRTDGAIYQAGQQMELFADLKARRIGDILTIKLNESTAASKNAVTKTTKATAVANTGPTIFGKTITTKGVPILNTSMTGSDSFDG
jgi:flagellar L-ring protein precursor FlgH